MIRHPILRLLAAALIAAGLAAPAVAADLEVRVEDMPSGAGDVHIAVYDRPEAFPDSDGMRVEVQVPIADGTARWRFTDLPPGRYAVAVYHDEDGDDDFDQGLFGIPLEDHGFSSGATAFLSAPAFEAAAFAVPAAGAVQVIRLNP